jgi:bis(5'-nucleosidyl)-tetraphosphatase
MPTPKIAEAAGLLLVVMPPAARWPDRFLLMRHADRWDLPKGHREPGESLRETAIRETEEETGIDRSQIGLADDFVFRLEYEVVYRQAPGDHVLKQVSYFIGRLTSELPIVCTEHLGFEWFRWHPPHRIQEQTIDPLLASVHRYFVNQNEAQQGEPS